LVRAEIAGREEGRGREKRGVFLGFETELTAENTRAGTQDNGPPLDTDAVRSLLLQNSTDAAKTTPREMNAHVEKKHFSWRVELSARRTRHSNVVPRTVGTLEQKRGIWWETDRKDNAFYDVHAVPITGLLEKGNRRKEMTRSNAKEIETARTPRV
jgi:hypothetical protein